METPDASRQAQHGAYGPRLSSSSKEQELRSQGESFTSKIAKRSSSVRFTEDIPTERSDMATGRAPAETDEITPIRTADGHADRIYYTTEPETSTDSSSRNKKPSAAASDEQNEERRASWIKRIANKYGSITLENKGSVARDHLALERTFLAWLRTSLAFASIGIAITQLFRLNTSIQTRAQGLSTYSPSISLPLSPMVGAGLPVELVPLLQHLAFPAAQLQQVEGYRNTLLDQLLALPSTNTWNQPVLHATDFNEHAAQRLRRAGKPLGATFIAISIIVLFVGFHRYFEAQYWIIRGKFPASRGSISLVGLIAGSLIISSLVVVLVVAPVSYQKT